MTLKREISSGAQFLDAVNTKYGTSLNADATPSMLLSAFKVGSETASYNKTDDDVLEDINAEVEDNTGNDNSGSTDNTVEEYDIEVPILASDIEIEKTAAITEALTVTAEPKPFKIKDNARNVIFEGTLQDDSGNILFIDNDNTVLMVFFDMGTEYGTLGYAIAEQGSTPTIKVTLPEGEYKFSASEANTDNDKSRIITGVVSQKYNLPGNIPVYAPTYTLPSKSDIVDGNGDALSVDVVYTDSYNSTYVSYDGSAEDVLEDEVLLAILD